MSSANLIIFSLVISAFALSQRTMAGDPDILVDYMAPENADGNFFSFTSFRGIGNSTPPTFKVSKASALEFPALIGQSVSYAALQFPGGSINPPHTHPRSAELLLVVQGSLQVGFVDTTNKLFSQTLQVGDMFLFPKGLVHFQHNSDNQTFALALSAFGSANAGTVSLPNTLFNSTIDDTVLALSFKTDVATIQTLKKGFAPIHY